MKIRIGALLLAAVFASCSMSMGKTININDIPLDTDSGDEAFPEAAVKVRVLAFSDERKSPSIGVIAGRSVDATGDLGTALQRTLQKDLRKKGLLISVFDSPASINGQLLEWQVEVRPAVPLSEVRAHAVLRLTISDSENRVVFSGRYEGLASRNHPFPNEDTVTSLLGEAMTGALAETARDRKFLDKLYELNRQPLG